MRKKYNVEENGDTDRKFHCVYSCKEEEAFQKSKGDSAHRRPLSRVIQPLKISCTYSYLHSDTNNSSTSMLLSAVAATAASTKVEATPIVRTKTIRMATLA